MQRMHQALSSGCFVNVYPMWSTAHKKPTRIYVDAANGQCYTHSLTHPQIVHTVHTSERKEGIDKCMYKYKYIWLSGLALQCNSVSPVNDFNMWKTLFIFLIKRIIAVWFLKWVRIFNAFLFICFLHLFRLLFIVFAASLTSIWMKKK